MLQIKNISKQYTTGGFTQKALDDVSLNLRNHEFVAILGPSGSGKTTFLNIVGGLDRYDSGDLIINGVSTKQYKDRDWDAYRNHSIGFVFQSYNLIPHQTVLANVELALTIGGISKKKRRKRAIAALEDVGLKEQIHKKPNQLSGGQMQRVAIARALVNNPDIVLADEPTGALDSETSIQVMDILKKISKKCLVVMVTHNPELADQYATRIVNIRDGKIVKDSNPFKVKTKDKPKHKRLGKASMGFTTALGLSFNNLKTKIARTIMVALAGSIGIIGIALILSLSNGVNKYIHETEQETLAGYPMEITDSSFSLGTLSSSMAEEALNPKEQGEVKEIKMIEDMISVIDTNDLASLKKYIESGESDIYKHSTSIEYRYNIEPQIYLNDKGNYRIVNPNESFNSMVFSSSSMMFQSSASSLNVFFKLPENESLYKDEYDLKYGKWPTKSNECILITSQSGSVSDFLIYTMGLRDYKQLDEMIENFAEGNTTNTKTENVKWMYEDFIGVKFKVVNGFKKYTYDENQGLYIDRSDDKNYMNEIAAKSRDLEIVGIASLKEGADLSMLGMGIHYDTSLIDELREESKDAEIVKAQLANPKINVLTGKEFGEENNDKGSNFSNLFTVDSNALSNAFQFDSSKLKIDTSSLQNVGDLSKYLNNYGDVDIDMDQLAQAIAKATSELGEGYLKYASKDASTDYSKLSESMKQYLQSDSAKELIAQELTKFIQENGSSVINSETIQEITREIMAGYVQFCNSKGYEDVGNIDAHLEEYLSSDFAKNIINKEAKKLLQNIMDNMDISAEQVASLAKKIAENYDDYAKENGMPEINKMAASFEDYLKTDEAKKILGDNLKQVVDVEDLISGFTTIVGGYIAQNMTKVMYNTMASLPNAIKIDPESFTRAFKINMSEDEMESMMAAMMSSSSSSLKNNLRNFGFAEDEQLSAIVIYPIDFDAKAEITKILDEYNDKMKKAGEEEKVISYTDIVGTMMKSVTQIVNAISYVLIAFTAISLIVSSIMISVITYISVLERRKEIGILRALGASKHNITQVFNSETLITGFIAGLLGVEVSRLIMIPANIIIHSLTKIPNLSAYLSLKSGIILIILSIIITLIAGLIPSHGAAKQDPVIALRTE